MPAKPGGVVKRLSVVRNNWQQKTVSADVALPAQGEALIAIAADPNGPSGDFSATDLSESSSWVAGGNSGDFNWSYKLRTPPAFGGPAPDLTVGYSAQSVDGRTSTSNNQPSWLGEGFTLTESYVERRYIACSDDGQTGKGDLCWKTDNANLMLNGKSSQVIKDDTSGEYKLSNDDGSRVELLKGAGNADDNGEYWKVTTSDGTQYFFGRDKTFGYQAGDRRMNSVLTVPVAGDDSGEPCYNSAGYASSFCDQGWRWNLDMVLDTDGNAMTYWYAREKNRYAKNLAGSYEYDRGGYLERIEYGQRDTRASIYSTPAPAQVVFTVAERCIPKPNDPCGDLTEASKAKWPDVPYDQICSSTTDCTTNLTPTFFTRKRLTNVETQISTGTGYRSVEGWRFAHEFYDPTDGTSAVLNLNYIAHTGKAATPEVTVPIVDLDYGVKANRNLEMNGTLGLPAFKRYRLASIDLESGGRILVTYAGQECYDSNRPVPETNTKRCFPQRWTPKDKPEVLDWFNKYVVAKVTEIDPFGGALDKVTNYSYGGGSAWRYTEADGLVKDKYRTWSQWRGYGKVATEVGSEVGPTGPTKTYSQSIFYRGMDNDRTVADGSAVKTVNITDSQGVSVPDSDQLAGLARESTTRLGDGGAQISTVINTPFYRQTAVETEPWAKNYAFMVGDGTTHNRVRLSSGTDRVSEVIKSYDAYGRLETVDDRGDTATSADDRCATTEYASRNTTDWITEAPARTETVSVKCADAAGAARPDSVVSDARSFYDNGTFKQAPTKGNVTRAESVAFYSGTTPTYQADSRTVYDSYGRVTSVTDGMDNVSTIAYTDGPGGATKTLSTGPAPFNFTSTSELDPAFGSTTATYDANNKKTTLTYDALGRLTSARLPDQAGTGGVPNRKFDYSLSNTAVSWVSTSVLQNDGTYRTSYKILDGLLRERQSQTPAPGGGRLITDSRYNQHGLVAQKSDSFYATGSASSALATFADSDIPGLTATNFDRAERPTTQTFSVKGVAKWSTTTAYGGDRALITPPSGGTATAAITDARGRTTELRQYTTAGTPTGAYLKTTYGYDGADRLTSFTDDEGNNWANTYDLRGNKIKTVDPDKGTSTTTYDPLGRVKSSTTANGTVAYVYDKLGRKTESHKDSAAGALLTKWTYDRTGYKGQPDASTRYDADNNAYTWTTTVRDEMYRPKTESLTVPASQTGLAGTYTFGTAYNVDGTIASQSLPASGDLAAETVYADRNLFGQELATRGKIGTAETLYASGSNYTKLGQLDTRKLGTTTQNLDYEEGTNRLASNSFQRSGITGLDVNWVYSYDPAGNMKQAFDTPTVTGGKAQKECYEYDYLRRITDAWTATSDCATAPTGTNVAGAAPYWRDYSYDDQNNRKSETWYGLAGAENTVRTYEYPAAKSARPHALTKLTQTTGTTSRVYENGFDDAGNGINRKTNGVLNQTLTWDVEGRLVSAVTSDKPEAYLYDDAGTRLLKTDGSGTTLYMRGTELKRGATGTLTAKRYYAHHGNTVAVRSATGISYQLNDHHDTSGASIDGTGAIKRRYFDPFGTPVGTVPSGWPTDKGFLGGTLDSTGLTHLGAREYSPSVGRFISVDPLIDPMDPATLNGYVYARGNPATFSDPSGLREIDEGGALDPVTREDKRLGNDPREDEGWQAWNTADAARRALSDAHGIMRDFNKSLAGIHYEPSFAEKAGSAYYGASQGFSWGFWDTVGIFGHPISVAIDWDLDSTWWEDAGATTFGERPHGASAAVGKGGFDVFAIAATGGASLLGTGAREAGPMAAAMLGSRAGGRAAASGGELIAGPTLGRLTITAANPSASEVSAARYMAGLGNRVVLRDPAGTRVAGGTSDLLVNGKNWDVYTPKSGNVNAIVSGTAKKGSQVHGGGVIIDLSQTSVTADQLVNIQARVAGTGSRVGQVVVMP